MAKTKQETAFVCTGCGHSERKWMGKCPGCQAWNSFVEETRVIKSARASVSPVTSREGAKALPITDVKHENTQRIKIGIGELDRVLGGGLVPGSAILVGGEPGVGKSTILLTTAAKLASIGLRVLYVSAEESTSQTRMSAERLGALHDNLFLLSEVDLDAVFAQVHHVQPQVLFLDSVQTLYSPALDSAPGSVSQVREICARVVQYAKSANVATFLVGHVTKEGSIAGPRLLEHMVDTVLYFESTRTGPYRLLRAHKNRFGSTNEIGVFEMRGEGLTEVPNPSAFFLAERPVGKSGSVITAAMEGTRPILVEVQALCVQSLFGNPRRTTLGVDSNRTALLAGVLERRAGFALAGQDLFVNVAGGTSLIETAADLPVALAIASSLTNRVVDADLVCFGEIGLSGELRGVSKVEARLKEAAQLGFKRVLLPPAGLDRVVIPKGLQLLRARHIEEAVDLALAQI